MRETLRFTATNNLSFFLPTINYDTAAMNGGCRWIRSDISDCVMSNDHHDQQQNNNSFLDPRLAGPPQQDHGNSLPTSAESIRASAQRRVDHTYRDYSNFPLEELPTRKRAPTNFPSKLHQILSNHEYSHVSQMPCHDAMYHYYYQCYI